MSILDVKNKDAVNEIGAALFDVSIDVNTCDTLIGELCENIDDVYKHIPEDDKKRIDSMLIAIQKCIRDVRFEIDCFVDPDSEIIDQHFEEFTQKMLKIGKLKAMDLPKK